MKLRVLILVAALCASSSSYGCITGCRFSSEKATHKHFAKALIELPMKIVKPY